MNILVIGAGAIGCLVGAKLVQAGHSVTLVGRPTFAAELTDRGLILEDERGRHRITDVSAAISIQHALSLSGPFDFAILTVKSFDTSTTVEELANSDAGERWPTVISLQNGVGNEEIIAAVVGPASVIAGTLTTPVSRIGPASVLVQKDDYCMGLSPWHPAVSSVARSGAQTALTEAGFTVTMYPDAQSMKWTKLLMNMIGNASCAILDLSPDQIFADRQLANLEIEAWRETLAVMRKAGISPTNIGNYPFGLLAPMIRTMPLPVLRRALRKSVGKARGGKMPSLHMDLEQGRGQSEVSWLNGATAKKGRDVNVVAPINSLMTDVLLALVNNPPSRGLWRGNRERLLAAAAEYRSGRIGNIM